MKKTASLLAVLVLALASAAPAWADHHRNHVHFGVVIGPYWGPWFYPPPPYYYYPPVVVQQTAPPVYIEQPTAASQAAPAPQGYWYFCPASNQYYPYVKDCAVTWQKVAPQPPAAP